MDLYRLLGGADLRVLDIPAVLETSVCLIEWPDRLGAARPMNRLGEKLDLNDCSWDELFVGTGLSVLGLFRHPGSSLSSFANRVVVVDRQVSA